MLFKVRILKIKMLMKVYKLIRNILPKTSLKLKRYIEKIALENSKYIYNKIKSN